MEHGANVISCPRQIAANPVTVDGRQTTPVVGLRLPGRSLRRVQRWSSAAGASELLVPDRRIRPPTRATITLEPMSKFPVVRDLWVDRSPVPNLQSRSRRGCRWTVHASLGSRPREKPEKREVGTACRVHVLRVLPGGLPAVQPGAGPGEVGHVVHQGASRLPARPACSTFTRPAGNWRPERSRRSPGRAVSRIAATPRTA